MRHPWKLPLAVVCLLALAFFPLLPAPRGSAQSVTYTATDIGTLGGVQSTALGLNECGKVVGESFPAGSTSNHPYFWDGAQMTDLGTFGGLSGLSGGASAVNGSERVAGYAQTATSEQRPFIWTEAAGKTDLGAPGTSAAAYDINDSNQIVGQWEISPLQDRAFVWTQATGMQLVTAPWGTPIAAYGINNAGHIVGTAQTSAASSHAFLSSGGVVTDLGTLGGTNSFAHDLNESDVVVGQADVPSNNASRPFHAFRWTSGGGMQDLGTLGGARSIAYGVNASGQIVGYAEVSPGVNRAFLWADDNSNGAHDAGEMKDLNTLAPVAGWTFEEARAINDRGQIVATAVNGSNHRHAFLLTPNNAGPSPCDPTPTPTPTPAPGALQFSASAYTVGENGIAATVTVTRAGGSDGAVSVSYATSNGTATAGSDYTAAGGALNFAGGETSKTFNVAVSDDALDEPDETVNLTLSGATGGATLGAQTTAVLTITDNDTAPSLSAGDVTVTEGNSGAANAVFNVTLSAASAQTVTVAYATANNTATQPADYAAASGTLTFDPGDTLKTVTVAVAGDTVDEANETFFVNLSGATNATVADAQGVGTITDDDGSPSLSAGDVAVTEGNTGTTAATFTVSLLPASGQTVTVAYATADGTATQPADYAATSGTLTFDPGQTSKTVTVNVNGDTTGEAHENFSLNLSSPTNATISDGQGQATVNNDDAALSINDPAVAEGNAGTTAFSFTVSLSHASVNPVSVSYATSNGTATAGSDYTAASGTLNIAAGSTSGTISINVIGDTTFENNETFNVTLSSPSGATISDNTGVGTITNDEATSVVQFSSAAYAVGEAGASVTITVARTGNTAAGGVTVNYATSNGTATAGADYTAASGTLTFGAGETSKTFNVPISGDTLDEPDETVSLTLSSPFGATVGTQGTAALTITDDDPPPTLSVGDATVTESTASPVAATFTVTLSAASAQTVTVNYATASGTAAGTTAGSDYASTSGTLTFAPGDTSETFTVSVLADALDEADETFNVNLSSPSNAAIADGTGVGTIVDDDDAPSLSISDAAMNEGNAGTTAFEFTVTLSPVSGQTVKVDYATANGTATAGNDYATAVGTLTFAAGETSKTVTVLVNGDRIFENNETFNVTLSNASNATVSDGQAVGTITNDEATSVVQFSSAAYAVGEAGASVTITVTRTGSTAGGVTVGGFTEGGTAVDTQNGPDDYLTTSFNLTFAADETQKTFTVPVVDDTLDEPDETFSVKLNESFGLFGATLGTPKAATVTITDDDAQPTFQLSAAEYEVGEDSNEVFVFITGTGGTNLGMTVKLTTSDGTATAGSDYTARSVTVGVMGGETVRVLIPISRDTLDEADETFNITLSDPSPGAALGAQTTAVVTIRDDEGAPTLSVSGAAVTEGDSGTTDVAFNVSLLPASGQTVTVRYETGNGTASPGPDYAPASGTLTFNPGETSKTVTLQVVGDTLNEADEFFLVRIFDATNAFISADARQRAIQILNDDGPTLGFSQAIYPASESAHFVTLTVTRAGDTSSPVAVDFATSDVVATERKDYTAASGTLRFAAGETSKSFDVLLTEDAFQEPNENFTVTLSNPTGDTVLGAQSAATVVIAADDNPPPAGNPIDNSSDFVRQHYHDFLNREPDPSGLQFWTNDINQCGADAQCREVKRINVSAAFFLSIEFQETGYLVYRAYKAAYGDATSPGVPGTVPVVRLGEFLPDTRRIGEGVVVGPGNWQAQLEANKNAYMLEFVRRPRFTAAFPAALTPAEFVDKLNQNAGGVLDDAERAGLISELTADNTDAGRAGVLRKVAEDANLVQAEFNRAFVLMQYFGYLRRNPSDTPEAGLNYAGWNFWLGKLNEFGGDFVRAEMVKAFLDSAEYRNRFGQ